MNNELFDPAWYLSSNPDLAETVADPWLHYLEHGAREGRKPHPLFDGAWYLDNNPDVAAAYLNPLAHYVSQGASEGRKPNPLFDGAWYLESNPDVAEAGVNPLIHYLDHGASEGRKPHPLFDGAWYLDSNPDVAEAGVNPLIHYLDHGASEGRKPHPLFDGAWYLDSNPDVRNCGENPLAHYLSKGAAQGRSPNPLFEAAWYIAKYDLSIEPGKGDPLSHYISEEGRRIETNPNRYFSRSWYLRKYPDVVKSGIDPLIHFTLHGATELRDPGPNFDTAYYYASNPDVVAARIESLRHFLTSGEAEGREPRDIEGKAITNPSPGGANYAHWIEARRLTPTGAALQKRLAANFTRTPLISIIVPVYIVSSTIFEALIKSVCDQSYEHWELCIAVSALDDQKLLDVIEEASQLDQRIKVRHLEKNRGISHNSNDALPLASGEFIALLDHDDLLPREALFEFVNAINEQDGDLFYSDKDSITEDGSTHFGPLFKADWSPETMLGANYLTHFNVMRRSMVESIGGWDPNTDGAQDWDLFLRLVVAGARVRHVPKVLYHWRHVQTSVAARGFDAKPYAAQAQLRTLKRWLASQGWKGAEPLFTPEGYVRIAWSKQWRPSVCVVLFGKGWSDSIWRSRLDASEIGATAAISVGGHTLEEFASAIAAASADIVVLAPAALSSISADWLEELVLPLQNPEIALVSGKVLGPDGRIFDAGWVFVDDAWQPIFRGAEPNEYSAFGSATWYRNYSAVSFNGTAFRRDEFLAAGGLRGGRRPDIDFCHDLLATGSKRIVYNPFAASVLPPDCAFERSEMVSRGPNAWEPFERDPYFNPHLTLSEDKGPSLRQRVRPLKSSHDYEAEAGYFGNVLDRVPEPMREPDCIGSIRVISDPRRIAWIVPFFDVPFYGGILTILRCAEYFRRVGVKPVFIGLGAPDDEKLRKAIARAFPHLGAESEIFKIGIGADVNALGIGHLDAAFCTLWTTAFTLQALRNVGHKFYFVQDYEPLFYPAGTTSALVEGTYRFGFHGVCNTEPLKILYEQFGSTAEYFEPAIDPSIFHMTGRTEKRYGDPITIFSYARPGHPRNCFELLSPALSEVKSIFGSSIQIFTAGSDWSPSEYNLAGVVEHLGLMPYAKTADLYRACDVGVVAMATCHPSYLPFELMASGALVVTNVNRYTNWLLDNGVNCLQFELLKSSIVGVLSTAIENAELRVAARQKRGRTYCVEVFVVGCHLRPRIRDCRREGGEMRVMVVAAQQSHQ